MVADEVIAIFLAKGDSAYYGEDVSQLEHALQAAQCALQAGASDDLIVAALVHDIGHLVGNEYDQTSDRKHEDAAEEWLIGRFGTGVSEPARLHVAAKRYLCATDPAYLEKLSAASVQSLRLQGGPMNRAEVEQFEQNEFHREAVVLRRCDDEAKIPGLATPRLEDFRRLLNTVAANHKRS